MLKKRPWSDDNLPTAPNPSQSSSSSAIQNKRPRSQLQLRPHNPPPTQLTVTPPATTSATELPPFVFPRPGTEAGEDYTMLDVPGGGRYKVVVGPPTPVSDVDGDVDLDVEMNEPPAAPMTPTGAGAPEKKKKSESIYRMGYVRDCEKCRMRVQGHYSHY